MPVFNAKVQIDAMPIAMAQVTHVTYGMEPRRIAITQSSDMEHHTMDFRETRGAFKRYFEEHVVPHLWAETERQLFGALQITKRNAA